MERMDIILPDDLEKKFREELAKEFGLRKGNPTLAIHEDIKLWIETRRKARSDLRTQDIQVYLKTVAGIIEKLEMLGIPRPEQIKKIQIKLDGIAEIPNDLPMNAPRREELVNKLTIAKDLLRRKAK